MFCRLSSFLSKNLRDRYLHLGDVGLQPGDGVLVAGAFAAHAVLHVSHLAQEGLVLPLGEEGGVERE